MMDGDLRLHMRGLLASAMQMLNENTMIARALGCFVVFRAVQI